jgi:preprotein translocase subunit SecA
LVARVQELLVEFYERKCAQQPPEVTAQAERVITLRSIDTHWMAHIDDMAHLREQVAFSGFAQRDPLIEYQDQGFQRFRQLLVAIDATIIRTLLQVDFAQFAPRQVLKEAEEELANLVTNEAEIAEELEQTGAARTGKLRSDPEEVMILRNPKHEIRNPKEARSPNSQIRKPNGAQQAQEEKVGRNDPCPCGSGKKYKKCHGKDEA